jgi:hypothetical protein
VHGRFTIIFEQGLERVEHLTRGSSNQTYSNILAKVMKELAILGFASFAVLIAAQNMSSDDSHSPAMINFVSVSLTMRATVDQESVDAGPRGAF